MHIKSTFIPMLILPAAFISVLAGCGGTQTADTPTAEATVVTKDGLRHTCDG